MSGRTTTEGSAASQGAAVSGVILAAIAASAPTALASTDSSSASRSAPPLHRAAGSLARQRITSDTSPRGSSGRTSASDLGISVI